MTGRRWYRGTTWNVRTVPPGSVDGTRDVSGRGPRRTPDARPRTSTAGTASNRSPQRRPSRPRPPQWRHPEAGAEAGCPRTVYSTAVRRALILRASALRATGSA
ncbi:hypothetical protein GCM10023083_21590 [Streptomyces phyllanthi]